MIQHTHAPTHRENTSYMYIGSESYHPASYSLDLSDPVYKFPSFEISMFKISSSVMALNT